MTVGAILTMIITMGIVTAMVIYFFRKVLRAPGSKDGNSGDEKEG